MKPQRILEMLNERWVDHEPGSDEVASWVQDIVAAFTRAQTVLGIPHRSIYQAKHTYATLELLGGESPATVARNLGITLATLEKHYAAALQRGRMVRPVTAPRAKVGR